MVSIVARIGRGNFVGIALARGLGWVSRWELAGWEIAIRGSNPLFQLFNFETVLLFDFLRFHGVASYRVKDGKTEAREMEV